MIIKFKDDYAFLSNFWLCKAFNRFDGQTYRSVEHAYMSMKSDIAQWKALCLSDITPGKLKTTSNELSQMEGWLVEGWHEKKLEIMTSLVTYKFLGNADLQEKLLATGDQNLVEGNYHGDKFYGVCLKSNPNEGENHLGRILMTIRKMLQ